MNSPWLAAVSVCMAAIIVTQLAYAYVNRPRTWQWRLILFLPAFAMGGLFGDKFVSLASWGMPELMAIVVIAAATGIVFAFLFANNVRYAVPRRKDSSDKQSHRDNQHQAQT